MSSGASLRDSRPTQPVLSVRGLRMHFDLEHSILESALARLTGRPRRILRAVDGVSFDINRGETLGLVGESGCGKTTLGRSILRLIDPTDGQVMFHNTDLTHIPSRELRQLRARMQIVFQDPAGALNPRKTIGAAVGRALDVAGVRESRARRARCVELLASVGLRPELAARYPHQLSGGQKQRACIARALGTEPEFIVADEPVSSLDVSVQAQILNLLVELQQARGLAMLFISHDLSVVGQVSHRIAVMYSGRIMEIAPARSVIRSPMHPYTQCLLEAVPRLRHHWDFRSANKGIPNTGRLQSSETGCPFHPRCPADKVETCRQVVPGLVEIEPGHSVACHLIEKTTNGASDRRELLDH